ncbi:Aminomethyltransferase (glycine cleavage system T protein) [hydrothermal vent metagenome]|uniref:aminomethyltransferase n=1 Tax=hydrothermal vent metagenome TaxID=652676 RepID=A0A3B1CSJ7_9ZZZZ
MKKTPLYEMHVKHGAKQVPFSGWEMPLSYSGVTDEHSAVRNAAGLFDVSHMGRFELSGPGTDDFLDQMIPSALRKIPRGGAFYSMLLNDAGGIIDDIYLYKRGLDRYLMIVNASNRAKALKWLTKHLPENGPTLDDVTEKTALIALQGPLSWDILQRIMPFSKTEIALRKFAEVELVPVRGAKVLIARTGYTGEKGYEIVIPAERAVEVWEALIDAGSTFGLKPAGLGARDTLRLEMGYPLYGQEMDEKTTPIEASLSQFVDFEKDFIGKERLLEQKAEGVPRKLIGFELLARGIPRAGHLIYSDQKEVGKVSSGNYAPSLKKGIGMGYVDVAYSEPGSELLVDIRGKATAVSVVKKPFYRKKK